MTSEVKTKLNIPLAIFIGILSTFMYLLSDVGVNVGGFIIVTKFIFAGVIVICGLFSALIQADLPFIKRTLGDSFVLFLPYFAALIISLVIWMIKLDGFRQITRGMGDTFYQLLAVLVAWANVVMFREKAAYVQIIAAIAAFFVYIIQHGIIPYGFSAFGTGYLALVTTFADVTTPVMRDVEYHQLVYFFAVFVVYFVICEKKKSEKIIWFLICLFAFSFALKRIAVLAIAIGILFVLICKLIPINSRGAAVRFVGILMFFISIAYVILVKRGLFEILTSSFGVNTMGRTELYEYMGRYYQISPGFIGYGLGFIDKLLQSLSIQLQSVGAVHNDILKMYIELGFWGFIIWLIVSWIIQPSFFTKKRNVYTGLIFLGVYIFCFVTYATDNTLYYFYTNIGVFIAVLSCANNVEKTDKEI